MMYCILYPNSKGVKVTWTAMMCKRALQLDGIHVHKNFKLPTKDNLTPHRRAELAILNLMKNPNKFILKDMLMCWHLMKWVNALHRLSHHLTSYFVTSGISTYISVEFLSYFLWIIHISNSL